LKGTLRVQILSKNYSVSNHPSFARILLPPQISIPRGVSMKKQTNNAKKKAANDVEPEAAMAKAEKPEERYLIGNISTVRSGFYKELCDFVAAKQNSHGVDAETIRAAFVGRQINGRGISAGRCNRYIRYAVNHGQFKVVKNGGGAK
jgi:hypothetical protein